MNFKKIEKIKDLKTKALSRVIHYITNNKATIEQTRAFAQGICESLFSNCNQYLTTAFVEHCTELQQLYYTEITLDVEIIKYIKKKLNIYFKPTKTTRHE